MAKRRSNGGYNDGGGMGRPPHGDERRGKRQRREYSGGGRGNGHDNRMSYNKTVFVGNLSFDTTWYTLKDHMRQCGNVDVANILIHPDGSSKGCALVDYQDARDAQRALRELNHTMLDGRSISVIPDTNDEGANDRRMPASHPPSASSSSAQTATVFVGNIPYECKGSEVRNMFSKFGRILSVELPQRQNGRPKGFALVEFKHSDDASDAIEQMHRYQFQGRRLDVTLSRESSSDGKRGGGDFGGDSFHDQRNHSGPSSTPPSPIILFVGNIPPNTRWQDLKDHIRTTSGPIADDIQVHEGIRRTYSTVMLKSGITMDNAQHCIDRLNRSRFQNQVLEVRFDRKDAQSHAAAPPPQQQQPKPATYSDRNIFVRNLAYGTSWQNLKDHVRKHCSGFGVHSADIIGDYRSGKSKGVGTVTFDTHDEAVKAVDILDGTDLDGRALEVRLDRPPPNSGDGVPSEKRERPARNNNIKKEENTAEVMEYNLEAALDGALSSSR